MSYIEKEIEEQPAIIHSLLNRESENVIQVARAIRQFNPSFAVVVGRGTSDNAARYAQYLLGIQAQLAVSLAAPSIHTVYGVQPKLSRALVIALSPSGEADEVSQVIADARAQGGLTLSITDDPNSSLAQMADYHLLLGCGKEKSIIATKSYTAQLTALAMLVTAITDNRDSYEALAHLPDLVARTLAGSESILGWVQRYRYVDQMAVVGRGYNYPTAFEISHKIRELCQITAEEYSEADFRHGQVSIIKQGFPVIVIAPSGKPMPLLVDLLRNLNQRHAECIVITDDLDISHYAQNLIALPPNIPEWLSPICAVVHGQYLAMQLALAMGHEVDVVVEG
ncbi:MAG: glucosamine--fructose-6-phosphate aminotransferase [Phototrophicales bacterium]|nr:MAG: glucosamine--fructose-6-phosphate aminotransferase [Phototrophicales bacterium]